MTYEETLEWLHSMPRVRKAPTLVRTTKLLSYIGHPEKKLYGRFLHVTGTNGKGSVCAFLSSVLRRAGYRTGRFISPFIMEFTERIEVDGVQISREETAEIGTMLRTAAKRLEAETGELPLEFELVTAMGLFYFAQKQCDLVVLEVGIGGLYDPTNVVTPLLTCITRVDYDHTELLGDTLAEITAQKAGIIKSGVPCVLSTRQDKAVERVVRERCMETGSLLVIPERDAIRLVSAEPGDLAFTYQNDTYRLRLSGLYQLQNATCAIEALRLMTPLGFPVSMQDIADGLEDTRFPARFEVLAKNPYVILDGAHNASGIRCLVENMECYFSGQKIILLCGMLRDKYPESALSALFLRTDMIDFAVCITPPSPRALPAEALTAVFEKHRVRTMTAPDLKAAARIIRREETPDTPVLCFGSLYTAGDIRRMFDKMHADD